MIETITNFIFRNCPTVLQLSKKANMQSLVTAYHGLVTLILRYGVVFWGAGIQDAKRCLRSMCGLKSTDTFKPHFKTLKLLTVPSLYILETALFVK